MWNLVVRLWKNTNGAVAPTVALSLVGLIAAGGIAFDYAHLAAMDTELQQAADQAALAAATQLDRSEDSRARAATAIQDGTNSHRLAANFTRFANDGSDEGRTVEIASITFCKAFDDSVADTVTACDSTGVDDTNATFVVVTTSIRTAEYALTPIVAAFSGSSSATAVAGVQSSICNVAPLMVCAPDTPGWPTDAEIGDGIRLKPGAQVGAWVPGNFGLLDFGSGNNGVINALEGFGLNGCQEQDTTATEPGVKDVTDAINTRLDVYDKGDASICNPATGFGCPAPSARKDAIIKQTTTIVKTGTSTPPTSLEVATAAAAVCPFNPQSVKPALAFEAPSNTVKGLQRDDCHYTDTCPGGNIGNKAWDRNGYFSSNYGWDAATWPTNTGLPANATRFEVYQWELKNPTVRLASKPFGSLDPTPKTTGPASNTKYTWTVNAQCSYPSPKYGSTAYPAQKDRRILTVIAADCTKLKGKGTAFEDFVILRAFDVFLTEPSFTRTYPGPTNSKEIYGEIIGPATAATSGGGFQYYARAKPYLVR
jgi:Flp pilus assembly protein TadG